MKKVLSTIEKPIALVIRMSEKTVSSAKEFGVSLLGLIIAIILAVIALGIANWGIDIFGISGDMSKAAALVAVAIIIGPTIAAFATKKYF